MTTTKAQRNRSPRAVYCALPIGPMLAGAAGMCGPVLAGALTDHMGAGMLAALGAMTSAGSAPDAFPATVPAPATNGAGPWAPISTSISAGIPTVLITALAGLAGAALAGHGWGTAAGVTATALVVSLSCGLSRSAVAAGIRFVTLMVITTGLGPAVDPPTVAVLYAAGALWAVAVRAAAATVVRTRRGRPGTVSAVPGTASAEVAAENATTRPAVPERGKALRTGLARVTAYARRFRYLRTARTWHYPARLTLCLAAAETLATLWGDPKAYWIAVTVVIVVRPRLEGAVRRAAERAAGTAAGALAGTALLLRPLPFWAFLLVLAGLAGARPALRTRAPAVYAAVMTPLVMLLLQADGGQASPYLLAIRPADAALGCLIAIGAGYLPWSPRQGSGRK
ncbi:FUSC family protein [Microtetraspora malaysiensis]|uniref:FUSC family protein n=1 Tax=Microtetraspora malaysiensis TaxID=161358 RepID=UPI003D928F6A